MSKKKYVSLTGMQYTFPVSITAKGKDKVIWISFKGNENDYVTANKEVQDAIEATAKFKNGEIGLSEKGAEEVPGNAVKTEFEPKEYAEVADINGAVEVLKAEPYKVHHMKLKTPEAVKAAMEKCNVSFPNLELSEIKD